MHTLPMRARFLVSLAIRSPAPFHRFHRNFFGFPFFVAGGFPYDDYGYNDYGYYGGECKHRLSERPCER
jgi:hypothetical protein